MPYTFQLVSMDGEILENFEAARRVWSAARPGRIIVTRTGDSRSRCRVSRSVRPTAPL